MSTFGHLYLYIYCNFGNVCENFSQIHDMASKFIVFANIENISQIPNF